MSGGGGSTGQVEFPTHMEEVHQDWLGYSGGATAIGTDLIAVMDAALLSNPLDGLSYDEFTAERAAVLTEYDSFNSDVDALSTETDWDSLVDNAVAKLDESGVLETLDTDAIITAAKNGAGDALDDAITAALAAIDDGIFLDAVKQYVDVRRLDRARLRTRYKAGMANLNAQRSSAYALGMALLEIDFERETGEFQQQLELQTYQQGMQFYVNMFATEIRGRIQLEVQEQSHRDQLLLNAVQQQLAYKQFVFTFKQNIVQLLQEIYRIHFVMDQEHTASTAELNWKHDSWDFEVYHSGIAVLGGIGGGSFVPRAPSKAQSAIGGALQGAGTGAAVGTAIAPGIGTAIGAGVGAIAGGLSGLFV